MTSEPRSLPELRVTTYCTQCNSIVNGKYCSLHGTGASIEMYEKKHVEELLRRTIKEYDSLALSYQTPEGHGYALQCKVIVQALRDLLGTTKEEGEKK